MDRTGCRAFARDQVLRLDGRCACTGVAAAEGRALERRLEQHWHAGIARASAGHANIYIFDLKELVEQVGRSLLYSNKRWYLGGLRFSIAGEKLIARELERILDAQFVARKKCLLLDLDNTLWGGVIGEDGIKGIQLSETGEGARYRDFQLRIQELGQMGVILGIVSKNNEADALRCSRGTSTWCCGKDDFATMKINWSAKAQNIAEVAQDLDIGMDSVVFIDDNPVEREAIRTALPEVTVPEFPVDTCELASFFERVYKECFFTLEIHRGGSQAHGGVPGQRQASCGAHCRPLDRRVPHRVTHQDLSSLGRTMRTSLALLN